MPDFNKGSPTSSSFSKSTKSLTKTNISENTSKAKQSALDVVDDFDESITDTISTAIDDMVNSVSSTANKVIKIAGKVVSSVYNAIKDIVIYIADASVDIYDYIDKTINSFNESDVKIEKSVDEYADNIILDENITVENGEVQQNIQGTISTSVNNMSNTEKRDIIKSNDVRLQKEKEIKQKCIDNLVNYAEETSNEKFIEASDSAEIGININFDNLNKKVINIKDIKVTITNE